MVDTRLAVKCGSLRGASMWCSAERPSLAKTWYHSHPHITVLPSHVDVRTQGAWQLMDDTFVGLIFSVFNEEASRTQRIQLIAFQSVEVPNASVQTFGQREVPISVVVPPRMAA